jgi:hypothetical protein
MYYAAFLAIILHYSIILIPIIAYFITTSRALKLTIILYMWILLGINIYYKGCPLITLERKLLRNPSWIGIHEWLRTFILNPSAKLINGLSFMMFTTLMVAFWANY